MKRLNNRNKNKTRTIMLLSILIVIVGIFVAIIHIQKNERIKKIAVLASLDIVPKEASIIDIQTENTEEELIESIEQLEDNDEKEEASLNSKNDTKIQNSTNTYYIKVNNSANVVTIYKRDGNNEYQPFKAMICSTRWCYT